MEQRELELEVTVLSAKDLNKVTLIGKMDVYIIISISGGKSKQNAKTPVDKDGGTNPAWNFQTKFIIDEAAARKNYLNVVFKVKCERALGDKDIGEVHVPINELLQSPEATDGKKQFVSYQVRKPDGKPKGFINFAFQFGEKVQKKDEQPTIAYPPTHGVGYSSAYPPPASGGYYPPPPRSEGYSPAPPYYGAPPPQGGYPHHHHAQYGGYAYQQPPSYGGYPAPSPGYGYPPQPPGYGYQPPPPGYGYAQPGQKPPKKKSESGLGAGLLGGALGGMLIGNMISGGGFGDVGFDF